MAETFEINVLRERVTQLESEVTNSKESMNSAVNTMMAKVDELLQRMHIYVAPTLNAADASWPTSPPQSFLELAARGDSDGISRMFGDESDLSNLNERAETGDTALHIAVREGHLETVQLLRKIESDVAHLKETLNSAIGTRMSRIDEVQQRTNIRITPTPNAAAATSRTAPSLPLLELAARGDSDGILRMFGDATDLSNFNERAENGDSALHIAAREGHLEAVIVLLGKGAKINDLGHLLRTPLHCAAARGHLDVVQRLLESGAQVDARDAQYKTPLALAAEKEHKHIVDLLRQSMLQPSNSASTLESVNSINLVQYLKDNGVSLESSNSEGNGLVVQAARAGRWDIVIFLLERGVSATECRDAEASALVLAAKAGQADAVRRLLRRGAASHALQVGWALREAKSAAVVRVFGEEVPDAGRGRTGQKAMRETARDGIYRREHQRETAKIRLIQRFSTPASRSTAKPMTKVPSSSQWCGTGISHTQKSCSGAALTCGEQQREDAP